jgi:hypothetical protein
VKRAADSLLAMLVRQPGASSRSSITRAHQVILCFGCAVQSSFVLVVSDAGGDLAEEVKQVISHNIFVFFNDIAEMEPELAALKIKPDVDRTLD